MKEKYLTEPKISEKGIATLRKVLLRMRSTQQDGFPCLSKNGWEFSSTSLPQTTPEELDDLMELAGIIPDVVVPNGKCEDCIHSVNGQPGGYGKTKCCTCITPKHSNFEMHKENELRKACEALKKDYEELPAWTKEIFKMNKEIRKFSK